MNLLTSRPRLRRLLSALLAGAVTTWIAANNIAWGSEPAGTCSREDVARWHLALLEPDVSPSPATILETTETFLQSCPDRPEAANALAIAGMASVELGNAERAVDYFERAGPLKTLRQRFYHAAALLSVGRTDDAIEVRDALVEAWLEDVWASKAISTSIKVIDTGRVVQMVFADPDRLDGVARAWVALPSARGWPAAIRLSRQGEGRFLPAHLFEAAEDRPLFVEFYRCTSRRLLGQVSVDPDTEQTAATAEAALRAYLNAPDGFELAGADAGIDTCIWPDRILPLAAD